MKLEFLFAPTADLEASLALYRDELGCEEVWREGDTTVTLALPGTDVQLMLDANDQAHRSGRSSSSKASRRFTPRDLARCASATSPPRFQVDSWRLTRIRPERPSM
ncbi:hypothetical protein BH18ACT7_BH18ACT7_13010 [soil metagenome]